MMLKSTVKDIAKAANVSSTAVSMAINDRPGVSEGTREKIKRIAKELNYIPNYAAKSLISRQSQTIGLIISDITDPFFPELAKGIEQKADELGYSIILCNTGKSAEREKKAVETLLARGVAGIIFSTVRVDDRNIDSLIQNNFPFVTVNRMPARHPDIDKIDYVILDCYKGGYMAIEHLYRLGHDIIAIFAGSMNTSTAISRKKGAQKALADYELRFHRELFVECDFSREAAIHATHDIMNRKETPTAIFSHDDHMAIGIREALLTSGVRIPEDVALVGFDDIDMAAITGIELTTISQKKYEMGAMAANLLTQKIEDGGSGTVNKIVLDAELIVRKSCGFSATGYVR
jgi:LacI family transcriptional regulator